MRDILIKPIISEKSEVLSDSLGQYSFIVDKKANKVEVKKAVELLYNVQVDSVNTLVMPSKSKNRNTRAGMIKGRVNSFKKAIVTLSEGDTIDFFGDL